MDNFKVREEACRVIKALNVFLEPQTQPFFVPPGWENKLSFLKIPNKGTYHLSICSGGNRHDCPSSLPSLYSLLCGWFFRGPLVSGLGAGKEH